MSRRSRERGYGFAAQNPDTYHGVSGFDIETGKTPPSSKSFLDDGGRPGRLAQEDLRICAITAAMKSGTCLTKFAERFPVRFFDVGIAEEHAVTFAPPGLATGGCCRFSPSTPPFCSAAIDQILNDTSIMNNHIVLAVDRAGIVPDDGETHQGVFDVPFLTTIPT